MIFSLKPTNIYFYSVVVWLGQCGCVSTAWFTGLRVHIPRENRSLSHLVTWLRKYLFTHNCYVSGLRYWHTTRWWIREINSFLKWILYSKSHPQNAGCSPSFWFLNASFWENRFLRINVINRTLCVKKKTSTFGLIIFHPFESFSCQCSRL